MTPESPSATAMGNLVLLAEDEWLLRWSLERALTRRGFQVIAAETSRAALDAVAKHEFAWFISDYKMPDMDGLTALGEGHRMRTSMKLLLMTAYGTPEIERTALQMGARYLAKPFEIEKIVEIISGN
ncbi:MAG: response regulator [Calditrichaeota bacterium]|nr:response regulator [Calditrichota bacterium]